MKEITKIRKAVCVMANELKKAGMVEVIAANDRLYENAVHMNQYAIDRI